MPAQPTTTAPSTSSGRTRGFHSGAREIDDAPITLRGSLPAWLNGTLLLNGPALWELPQGRLQHWFDGYAMLHALRFAGGAPRYRSRFIRSESYRRSVAAGRPVYGEFGSPDPSGLLTRLRAPQVTDNPAVVMSRHGSRWFAVTETPKLTYFDPQTLATQERIDLGATPAKLHLMSAHGCTLDDGSYLNVGTTLGRTCEMKLFRLPPASSTPEVIATITLPRVGYTHALALAPGQAIVWETALRGRSLAFRFGGSSYADKFDWRPADGSRLHAVDLASGAVRSWNIAPMMAFHATQAWSEGEDLLIDLAVYDDGAIFGDLMLGPRRADAPLRATLRHRRYRLRPGREQAEAVELPAAIELQQVHPLCIGRRRALACWGITDDAQQRFAAAVLKLDAASGTESGRFARDGAMHLEPLFVPDPRAAADDAGVLFVPTLAPTDEATIVAVVDARTMQPLAELQMPQIVPFGFHAAYSAT